MDKKRQKPKFKAPPRVKVGLCWYVKGYDGRPIVGLSWDSGNGSYFPTHYKDSEDYQKTGKRPYFSKNYDKAICEYRKWKDKGSVTEIAVPDRDFKVYSIAVRKRSAEEIKVIEGLTANMSEQEKNELGIDGGISETVTFAVAGLTEDDYSDGSVEITHNLEVTEPLLITKAKELFAQYPPSVVAQKFGMPSLAKIDYVDDLMEPYTLKQIADSYFKKVEFDNATAEQKKELNKVKNIWKQFCKIVTARTAKELAKEQIKAFYDEVYREYKRKNYSSTWIKGRFERIKRVINTAIIELDNVDDIITAKLKIVSILKAPKTVIKDKPYRIPNDAFHNLLQHSNIEERCMWLLSMHEANEERALTQ